MAELTSAERLQPSLLDRLSDDARGLLHEPREQRVLSMRALRKAVLRDLGWLLNSANLNRMPEPAAYPLVARSVLNFGLPGFAGQTATSLDPLAMARRIEQVIADFEPRVLPASLRVTPMGRAPEHKGGNLVAFEIQGELWGQPLAERLYLKTELDLEAGSVTLHDISPGVRL